MTNWPFRSMLNSNSDIMMVLTYFFQLTTGITGNDHGNPRNTFIFTSYEVYFLWCYMLASIRHYFPRPRAHALNCGWRRTPGISPLRGSLRAARRQGYHYRQTRSLRYILPLMLLDGRVPLCTFVGRLLCSDLLHRWSWRVLRIARLSADVIQSPDIKLSRFRGI